MTRHLPLSTVIGHIRDILNDPAAGVLAVCPSFRGFVLQGYVYDFVWAFSVTHEGCLYLDVRLQEKPSNEHDIRGSTTTNLPSVTLEDGIFSMYFCITILCNRLRNFSLLKIFCSTVNVLITYKL